MLGLRLVAQTKSTEPSHERTHISNNSTLAKSSAFSQNCGYVGPEALVVKLRPVNAVADGARLGLVVRALLLQEKIHAVLSQNAQQTLGQVERQEHGVEREEEVLRDVHGAVQGLDEHFREVEAVGEVSRRVADGVRSCVVVDADRRG